MPPLLIEKYLDAAEDITDEALLTEDEYRVKQRFRATQLDDYRRKLELDLQQRRSDLAGTLPKE